MANPYTCMNEAGITLPAVCVNPLKIYCKWTLTSLCFTNNMPVDREKYQLASEIESDDDNRDCAWICCKRAIHVCRTSFMRSDYVNTFWGYTCDLRKEDGSVPDRSFIGIIGVMCNSLCCVAPWTCVESTYCADTTQRKNNCGWCINCYGWGSLPKCRCYPTDACANKRAIWTCSYSSRGVGDSYPYTGSGLVIGLGDGTFVLDGAKV